MISATWQQRVASSAFSPKWQICFTFGDSKWRVYPSTKSCHLFFCTLRFAFTSARSASGKKTPRETPTSDVRTIQILPIRKWPQTADTLSYCALNAVGEKTLIGTRCQLSQVAGLLPGSSTSPNAELVLRFHLGEARRSTRPSLRTLFTCSGSSLSELNILGPPDNSD